MSIIVGGSRGGQFCVQLVPMPTTIETMVSEGYPRGHRVIDDGESGQSCSLLGWCTSSLQYFKAVSFHLWVSAIERAGFNGWMKAIADRCHLPISLQVSSVTVITILEDHLFIMRHRVYRGCWRPSLVHQHPFAVSLSARPFLDMSVPKGTG